MFFQFASPKLLSGRSAELVYDWNEPGGSLLEIPVEQFVFFLVELVASDGGDLVELIQRGY